MVINRIKIGIVIVVVLVILVAFLPTFVQFEVRKREQLKSLKVTEIKTIILSNYPTSPFNKYMVIKKGEKIEINDKGIIDEFSKALKTLRGISINHPGVMGECSIEIKAHKNMSFNIFITSEGQVFACIPGEDRYNNRISDEFTSFIKDIIMNSKERNPTWIFPEDTTTNPKP